MLIVFGLLALLSLAAGGAKLAAMPQEVEFFSALGLDTFWLHALGAVQVAGAIACILPATRKIGAFAVATGFGFSAAMIFATGNMMFGAISLVPMVLMLLTGRKLAA
ncbi:DoxX family protein [uncultured Erythrobacter sp.]|uniref:DoxX family protein n=1 Tax=uncultured Erythrobacter sp. TaxID=263913 RepID=UPI002610C166|nr:DoxX family protein [uncultured Erythrobacter sp.]